MPTDAQFQLTAEYPANLDRCRRCGAPRTLHWADGSCRPSFSLGGKVLALLVTLSVLVAVLALAAWLLATAPAINLASVLAFACLVALVLGGGAIAVATTTSALRTAMDDARHEGGTGSA
jgi:small-conductance mechanosensitive channel